MGGDHAGATCSTVGPGVLQGLTLSPLHFSLLHAVCVSNRSLSLVAKVQA